MVSDFQSMALSVSDAPLQKRVAYAEKMRKVRKSDILKGKRDELKKKAVDLNASNDEKADEEPKVIGGTAQDEVPAPAVNLTELF